MPAFQQGKKPGSHAGRVAGSLIAFLFAFGSFLYLREPVFRGKAVGVIQPDAGKEIIKSTDARGIPEREPAEDGIKGSFLKHAAPDSDGSNFQFQSKQVGAQHAGREPWSRAKNRIAFLHDRIRLGKIEKPELHDIIPSAFGKHKGIRVKFKELGYESILKGGMTARVTR